MQLLEVTVKAPELFQKQTVTIILNHSSHSQMGIKAERKQI
jgi:hypothetical protein